MVIGIFGKTGSGKTLVSRMFNNFGFEIINLDELAKEVIAIYPDILDEISEVFGNQFISKGKLLRRKLGDYVFRSDENLRNLNQIFIKYIEKETKNRINLHSKIVIEGVILFDSIIYTYCDKIIYVKANKETAIKRLLYRDLGLDSSAIERRLQAQSYISNYECKADFIIKNDNNLLELEKQITEVIKGICIN